jgi:hypothetical protein
MILKAKKMHTEPLEGKAPQTTPRIVLMWRDPQVLARERVLLARTKKKAKNYRSR